MPTGIDHTKIPTSIVLTIKVCIGALLAFIAFKGTTAYLAKQQLIKEQLVQTACPTLFSVARTPRDTLLVMRSETMCINYVLKTLK